MSSRYSIVETKETSPEDCLGNNSCEYVNDGNHEDNVKSEVDVEQENDHHHSNTSNLEQQCDDRNCNSNNSLTVQEGIELVGIGRFQYELLILAGLCFASDAMEVLLLSFLSIVLQHEWGLSEEGSAFLTSNLFVGAMIGALILGSLADQVGRRPVFILSAFIISIAGLSSSLTNNYWILVIFIFIVGIGIGGLTVPFDTVAEFLPCSGRGKWLNLINYFWTMGSLFVILLAYAVLGEGGDGGEHATGWVSSSSSSLQQRQHNGSWRVFVALCTLPCLICTIVSYFRVSESPQWLCSHGRAEEALIILRKAAKVNGHSEEAVRMLFPADVRLIAEEEKSAALSDLFQSKWRPITLRLWGTWAGFGFSYYGIVMAITRVFEHDGNNDDANSHNATMGSYHGDEISFDDNYTTDSPRYASFSSNDQTFTSYSSTSNTSPYNFDYSAIFISSSAELIGSTFVILFIDRFGRVPTQVTAYSLAGLSIAALCFLASVEGCPRSVLVGAGFLAKVFEMVGTCTTWTATAEILTTDIRSTGHSAANSVARVGAFFSPFVVDDASLRQIGVIMLVVHAFIVACAAYLPETTGRNMGIEDDDPVVAGLILQEDRDDDNGGEGQVQEPSCGDNDISSDAVVTESEGNDPLGQHDSISQAG